MPSRPNTGRKGKHSTGYIAVGYQRKTDFWFSSEGVFKTAELARLNLEELFDVENSYAIRIPLRKNHAKTLVVKE
jgi:hypothetical protein